MPGKTLKTLFGLGSASAAAAGGLYLNNKFNEKKETVEVPQKPTGERDAQDEEAQRTAAIRSAFVKLADDNAEKIEKQLHASEDTNSYYLPRSTDADDYWEWLWLDELNALMPTDGRTYAEKELEEKEKKVWEDIKKGTYMGAVPRDKKEEIEGKNPEYWRKYKETCLTWSSIDTSKRDTTKYFVCLSSNEAEYFMEKDTSYQKYQELKATMPNLTLRKYFWTMWFKFFNEENPGSSKWGEQFDAWKKKDENKHLFSEAG